MYAKYKQKTPSSQEDMQTVSAYSSLHNMFHLYGFFLLCIFCSEFMASNGFDQNLHSPFSPAMSHPLCVLLRDLNLKRPIYQQTASYGHFGRPEFSWEVPKKLVL